MSVSPAGADVHDVDPHRSARADRHAVGELTAGEIVWRDQYVQLLEKGYQLRPRYRPGWEGPWKKREGEHPWLYEDGFAQFVSITEYLSSSSDNSP